MVSTGDHDLRVCGFMNVEFALRAIRQILNIFDLDL